MNTLSTVLAVLIILISIAYPIFYWKKKKNNTHLQVGYKITFVIVFILLAVVVFNLLA
ncbi:hypothetical protein [Paenibacillus sp. UMB4589-SE434]|uniref:hypothetical protein n=1 Tax=Paenibacillus sp. UMB4589-SE434 TaxID=3046314 RepID=UPI002550A26E|nr:hypothetical protein [Paenibacillus sp. UMB4589-SE434]MDK8179640.1 hypothetical protein [Paenibacillus sp. UMB4589-SE434]